jgi:class 3 adenylate cyclase
MEPAPELVVLTQRLWRAIADFNADHCLDAFSRQPGGLLIGSADGEWWAGYDTVSAMIRIQFNEMPPVAMDVEETVAWKEGTVGWVASRATATFEGMPPFSLRLTLVLREEGAYWRIAQWHSSAPVPNEDVVGVALTTTLDELLTTLQDEPPPVASMAGDGSVTIVFTDIEGSTSLLESLGEERWLELLQWHDVAVRHQTALFGGSVVKGQGDGFMLAFPASGSAVACATAVQRAMSSGWEGVPVLVRIGLHAGNAKAERGDFFGHTVVVAARVAGAADGGEILASQAVQEDLGGAFRLGGARSLALKGLSGQHTAFPVIWD